MRGIRGLINKGEGTAGLLPLGILFVFYLVDQLDSNAFATVTPEVKAAFNLTNASLGLLFAANFAVLLAGSVYIGYLADRWHRVRLVIALAVIAVAGSVFTGLAPVLWIFVLARLVNGAGVVGTQPLHRSLLSDYYHVEDRGTLFGLHQSADPVSSVLAPLLAGTLGTVFGWRSVFLVLALPIAVTLFVAVRLREPLRGGTDAPELAAVANREEPLRFGQAYRTMSQSKTLRRSWIGFVFIGAGFLPLVTFAPLFLQAVFGLSLFQRGVIGAVSSLFSIAGLVVAGLWVRRDMQRNPARIQAVAGATFVAVAAAVALFAVSPTPLLAAGALCLLGFTGGFFVPTASAIQAYVAPPRVRTQAFAIGAIFLAAGAFLTPIAGNVADHHGLRTGLLAFTPFLVLGGLVMTSARRFVEEDRLRALASLQTAVELHHERVSSTRRALLVCRGLDVWYGSVQVLFGVDFEVEEGEIVALLGTNGAGKSTLLKAVTGVVPPGGGLVFFDGRQVDALKPWETASRGVVMMPGGKSIFPMMSVRDNLQLAGWLCRRSRNGLDRRIAAALDSFPQLAGRGSEMAGNLSGGEQQMLSLAQAFIAQPRLLAIDELSLGLSPKILTELLAMVRRIHDSGVTLILVEQSVNVAMTVAQRAYFMEKGEIRFSGRTVDLLDRPDVLRSVFLEGAATAALSANGGKDRGSQARTRDRRGSAT